MSGACFQRQPDEHVSKTEDEREPDWLHDDAQRAIEPELEFPSSDADSLDVEGEVGEWAQGEHFPPSYFGLHDRDCTQKKGKDPRKLPSHQSAVYQSIYCSRSSSCQPTCFHILGFCLLSLTVDF